MPDSFKNPHVVVSHTFRTRFEKWGDPRQLQDVREIPFRKEELKTNVNGLQMKSVASFISIVGILSGPGALLFLNC